jgi:hypothetical protein
MESNTNTNTKNTNQDQHSTQYVASLTPKEKKAYEIAKSHLGTSFDLEKSRGFQAFLKSSSKT